MKTRLPLRWILPAGVALVLFLVGAVSLLNTLYTRHDRLLQQAQRDVLQYAAHLAREAEQGFPVGAGLLEAEVALIAADPRTTHVLLLDDDDMVLTAHRLAWRGRPVREVFPGLDAAGLPDVAGSRLPVFHGEGLRMSVLQPFLLPADESQLLSTRHGRVYVAFDLARDWRQAVHDELINRWPDLAGTLVLLVLVVLWLQRQVARPLDRLVRAASELGAGRLNTRVEVAGPAEIDSLVRSFNGMAEAIQSAQAALAASEARLAITLQSIGDALIATDREGRIRLMNPVAESLTGWSTVEATGRPTAEVFVIENSLTGGPASSPVDQVLAEGRTVALANHTVLVARDGRRHHIADTAAPIRGQDGGLEGVVLVFHDVTEQYRLRAALAESERHYRTLANSGMALIWTSGPDGRCDWFNDTWLRFTGRSLEQEVGDGWAEGLHPEDAARVLDTYRDAFARRAPFSMEYRLRHASGEYRWIVDHGNPRFEEDGRFIGYIGYCLDITALKRAEAEIQRLAYHDDLTGLPNRALFLDRLGQALSVARRVGHYGAVIFVDLDQFKRINDVHGHAVGDALLEEVARRLTLYLREADTVARLGGDEFVVLLPELARTAEDAANLAMTVAEKLRAALATPVSVGMQEFNTGASLGITVFPKGEEGVDDLMREADVAMYRAKERGRNQVVYFEPAMQAAVTQRYVLEQALREAVHGQGLQLYLQSQVDGDGRVLGAEALVRWQHPQHGLIPPTSFIPLAEESGLIVPLGEWILRESCRLIARLDALGHGLRIAVNVSPRQFREPDFPQRVRHILIETGADPTHLMLEITENLLVDRPHEAVARMTELATLGIRFAIDDFGTGYSSLAYLKRLPLFELKIDKGFVQDVPQDANDVALVETILSMARHLQLEVVAEGVETREQLEFLVSRGCQRFQGYYWQHPLPLEDWVASFSADATMRPLS
jgi:diguanylate cyclase (GGDEF)-like protein/PAS domain S-box-containing protein